jgi:hypothetical protein
MANTRSRGRPQRRKRKHSHPWHRIRTTAAEITCVLQHRYPIRLLPDDDAGRDDADLMLAYLAHVPHGDVKMVHFLDAWCPWMGPTEREQYIQEAARSRPPRFTADELAERLGVTYAERQHLGLRLIGAVGTTKKDRERLRRERYREKDRQRKERERRAKGRMTRAEYLAKAAATAKEWEAEGISRRTWERRRKARVASVSVSPLGIGDGTTCDSTPEERVVQRPTKERRTCLNHRHTTRRRTCGQTPKPKHHLCRGSRSRWRSRWLTAGPASGPFTVWAADL